MRPQVTDGERVRKWERRYRKAFLRSLKARLKHLRQRYANALDPRPRTR